MAGFLPAHRREPHISRGSHLSRLKAALASEVLALNRVYLDTRYWILLRDAFLGRPAKSVHRDLLDVLLREVTAGRLICPLNESAFFELTKQRDPARILASARLMDQLSLGVVIQNTLDRVRTELHHFITECMRQQAPPSAPLEWVWLKVGHVIGTPTIVSASFSAGEELAIQKAFADVLWCITMEEMLTDTELPDDRRVHDQALAARVSQESARHKHEMKSFSAVYEAELAGFWDACEDAVAATLLHVYEAAGGPGEVDGTVKASQTHLWKNALRNVVHFDKAGAALPTSQIVAGLHAIIRWSKNRGFRANDTFDFQHAAAALPYCDVFLTQRFLATMLTRPPLSFSERFKTVVVSDEDAALALLRA